MRDRLSIATIVAVALALPACGERSSLRVGTEYYFDEPVATTAAGPFVARLVANETLLGRPSLFVVEAGFPEAGRTISIAHASLTASEATPLLDDPDLRKAQATYDGRNVWAFGTFYVRCGRYTPDVLGHGPLRVRRIVRLASKRTLVAIGPAGSLNPANKTIETIHPLVVFFDPPARSRVVPYGHPHGAPLITDSCANQWTLADLGQLPVTYSLAPPERTHPEWSFDERGSVDTAQIVPGMTHAMVAWALGFPSQRGTAPELMHARAWSYPQPAPGGATVTFAGDRVVRYDPPKRLP